MKGLTKNHGLWMGTMVIGLCMAFFAATSASAKTYKLTYATQHPAEAPMNKVVNQAWIKWLDAESNGKLKVTLYPAEQIAKSTDLYDAAMNGLSDIACQMIPLNPGRWPLTEVTMLPFLYDFPGSRTSALTAKALFDKYPEIQAEFRGVKVLGFHANGLSHVHTANKPIYKLEDLKGELLHTMGMMGVDTITALGATAENLSPSEMYDALAKGVVTGNVLEWEGQFVWHMGELTHYSTEASLTLFLFVHVMNLDTWNSLPPDIQALFEGEKGQLFDSLQGYNFDKDDIMFKGILDKKYKKEGGPGIIELSKTEKARWVKAVQPVYAQWLKTAAKKVGEAKARAILADAKKFSKQFSGYPDEACPDCGAILKKWAPAQK